MGERFKSRALALSHALLRRPARGARGAAVRRVLIAHNLLLGDTLMLTPLLAKLAANHPGAEVTLLASPPIVPLYANRPYGVRALPFTPRDSSMTRALLEEEPFDLAVVIGDNRYSWLAAALRARHVVAHAGDAPWTKQLMVDETRPYAREPTPWSEMVANLVDGEEPAPYARGDWPAPQARDFALPPGPYAVLHIGASTALKLWPPQRWLALARHLEARGLGVVWSGGRGEEAIVAQCDPQGRYASLAGQLDLPQVWRLLSHAAILVAPDTGIAHMGRATFTPTATLYGPGSAVLCGPGTFWRDVPQRALTIDPFPCRDQRILFRRRVEWVRRCVRSPEECAEPRCMDAIELSAVIAAAESLLQALPQRNSGAPATVRKTMKNLLSRILRLLLAATLATASLAHAMSVPGEPALTPKAAIVPTLRLASQAPVFVLSPITDSEIGLVRQANRSSTKRVVIGVARRVAAAQFPAAADLAWSAVQGGFAAQAAVRSPGAGALRLAIDLAGVPESVEMVFFGSDDPARLLGPERVGQVADRGVAWWSPLTDGDTQTVEFFVPGDVDPRALPLRVSGASHVFTTIASRFAKRVSEIGQAGSCNVDIQCSPLKSSQAFLDARSAVAQMVFQESGFTGLCTGTLLNDADTSTQVPWFYGANHCFENESLPVKTAAQMQAVASTLNTLWFFEAISCSNITVPPYTQRFGGATLIYNNPGADVLFLRLNDAPPAGSYFAGWDSTAVPQGAAIVVIHHPQGDLKKVSQGSVLRYSTPQPTLLVPPTTPFSEVTYNSGTTEGGSSGSGLFTFNGSQYVLRGGLYGGGAFCDTPNDSDWYSQFDKVYTALAPYLGAAPSNQVDYTDLWWNPSESGWGLNIIQHASRNIFAVWYTYGNDAKPMWFTVPGGTWTTQTTFNGDVYATSGPAANTGFDPTRVIATKVGTATLTFSDANNGTWAYTINGVSGTKSITRQPY